MNIKLQQILLFPFAVAYGLVIRIRNFLFDTGIIKSASFDLPIISVGNLTVGGTGKTPHIEYLAGLLKQDHVTAVLSRGYKRKTRDFLVVETESAVRQTGDEPLQIKLRHPELTVAVDRDRVNGVEEILTHKPETEIILLDDAFQHRYINPGLNILLVDYNRPIDKDCLLPAGRLREYRSSVKRADMVIITKSPHNLSLDESREFINRLNIKPGQKFFFTGIEYDNPARVFGENDRLENIEKIAGKMVNALLVTGIADPAPLINYIRGFGFKISHLNYPDHHNYSDRDCKKIIDSYLALPSGERCIITTEKDALRLREKFQGQDLPDNNIFLIAIKVSFLKHFKDDFDKNIIDYVKENRRNGRLS